MDEPIKTLKNESEKLHGDRKPLLSFLQEIAENFLPMRAQFTRQFYLAEQFADKLLSSYPLLTCRDLKNSLSAMLRPREQDWFEVRVDNYDSLDKQGKSWLEWASGVQRRAMYDPNSMFVRATKEGDGDFAAFGNAVISREVDLAQQNLLYRCWHLKDTVWAENYAGKVSKIYRNWKPDVSTLCEMFPKTVDQKIKNLLDKEPFRLVDCLHAVIPGDVYDRLAPAGSDKKPKSRLPFASIYMDVENGVVLQEVGSHSKIYTIPRWETVSGSQYAYSPAAVAGLPDSRLLQAMTLTLLEAGEIAVRPPVVAQKEVIRSDISIYAGGVTWVDAEYDERMGEALRALYTDKGQIPVGMQMLKDAREMLTEAFYLNKLAMPPPDREMTAYETGQRIQEWIRQALPLFEPVEQEYNSPLCEDTFESLMRVGAFGPASNIPQSLRGQNVHFRFESPLHQATERKKGSLLLEASQLITAAVELDPTLRFVLDGKKSLRDALDGVGVPPDWLTDPEVFAQLVQNASQQEQIATRTAQVQNAAQAGESLGRAAQALGGAAAAT